MTLVPRVFVVGTEPSGVKGHLSKVPGSGQEGTAQYEVEMMTPETYAEHLVSSEDNGHLPSGPAAVVVTDDAGRAAVTETAVRAPVFGFGLDSGDSVSATFGDPEALRGAVAGAIAGAVVAATGGNGATTFGPSSEPSAEDAAESGRSENRTTASGGADSRSRLERLHEGTASLVTATDAETVYESVTAIARDLLGFDFCYLGIEEDDEFLPVAADTVWQERYDVEFGLLGETYRTGESTIVEDVTTDSRWTPDWGKMRSALSVPLGDRGVFQAASDERAAFDEEDLELLQLLLSYAENTLARIESEGELRESRRRLADLHGGVSEFASIRTVEELYEATVGVADRVLALDRCSVFRSDGAYLHVAAQSEGSGPGDVREKLPHDHDSLAGLTIREGESHLVRDVETDENADPTRPEYRSGLSVPIGDHGVFQAVSTEPEAFDEVDLELAELLATHAAETLMRIEADEQLRTERDRLSALFENIPDAAVAYNYVDGEPLVRQVNTAFEEVFGWPPERVTGESIDDFILPDDGSALEDAAHLNEQLRSGNNVREEVVRLTASGPRHFLIHVVPVRLDAANISGYAIYTDVTERQVREEQLRLQNERLDEFASIVSHDLRNPLSVATGYLELAAETGDPEHFDRVERALGRMDDLVGDLLSLARQGEVVGERQTEQLRRLAEQAWANVATGDADLVIEEDRTMEVDPDRTIELLENLFRNAIVHGVSGEGSADIPPVTGEVRDETGDTGEESDGQAQRSAPTVRIGSVAYRASGKEGFYVEDDGPGIPDEEREKVFETGYTSEDNGTGLGLAIARDIAEAHGWDVRILSAQNGGARFEFKFDA